MQIPQISYASTAAELSDKTRYEYFTRVVPPDSYQSSAMAEIVKELGWTYVHTLADEGNYGEKGIAAFEAAARKKGICFGKQLKIKTNEADYKSHYEEIISAFRQDSRTKVVVLFVSDQNVKKFLNELHSTAKNYQVNELYFLASDSWGTKSTVVDGAGANLSLGAITLLPKREVDQEFTEYYTKLKDSHIDKNPWWHEFWQKNFNCTISISTNGSSENNQRTLQKCIHEGTVLDHYNRTINQKFDQQGYVPMVIDSVYALAHAISKLIHEKCKSLLNKTKAHFENKSLNWSDCQHLFPEPNGTEVLGYLRAVDFAGTKIFVSFFLRLKL